MDQLLGLLDRASPFVVYALLGLGAALENIVPPVPADTFVVLGGFLAARGRADVAVVFLVTWVANALSALAIYAAGYRYGSAFFRTRAGRWVLNPDQLKTVRNFYRRWGAPAIFYTRFLPGLRAVVPVFAGVSHQKPLAVAVLIFVASGIWYGILVWAGYFAGHNLEYVLELQSQVNLTLALVATILCGGIAFWWHRSRRRRIGRLPTPEGDESSEGA